MVSKRYFFVACIVVLAIGLFFGYIWGQGSGVAPAPISSTVNGQLSAASIMLDYGDGRVKVYGDLPVESGMSVMTLTEQLTAREKLEFQAKDYGELGMLIEQIGDKKNGDEGKYWQYWVNNVSIPRSASVEPIKAGDVIEWKFLNYQ